MKLIENKKLFGKINFLDILIVVVILVVGVFAYKKLFTEGGKVSIAAKYETTTCTIKVDACPVGSDKFLEVGADVYDNETNTYIGKLLSYEVDDYYTTRENKESGEYVKVAVPDKITCYLKVEVSVSDAGGDLITANNYYVKVGKKVDARCKNFAGTGFITIIDR
ncbi:MAG: DUF4330 family protein [Clostridia bacterium]|nr:DUF4330 family protein [Clostridia bacterium]